MSSDLADRTSSWGSSSLRRVTYTVSATQIVSWGVLFYALPVVASDIADDTGWSLGALSLATTVSLLVAGFAAPSVARALVDVGARRVLVSGSLVGAVAMTVIAVAPNIGALLGASAVVGVAMSRTLYEPAMAVVVAADPSRRQRTLTIVTVAGGLASTVFAPIAEVLSDHVGWRTTLASLGIAGGLCTAALHAWGLPRVDRIAPTPVERRSLGDHGATRLCIATLFETTAMTATTVVFVTALGSVGVSTSTAALALATMGIGKVVGRGALAALRSPHLARLTGACSLVQLAGLLVPMATDSPSAVITSAGIVGAAAGATTVLRPLLVIELVGADLFAGINARIQRATSIPRSVGPAGLAGLAVLTSWRAAWLASLSCYAVAAVVYFAAFSTHERTSRAPARSTT